LKVMPSGAGEKRQISYLARHDLVTNNSSGYRVREIFDVRNGKEKYAI
jgi:hypothetical protein